MTENKSGLWPIEHKCLVKIDSVEELDIGGKKYRFNKGATEVMVNGIYVPVTSDAGKETDQVQWKETRGEIIALGGTAFRDDFSNAPWNAGAIGSDTRLPRVGDRVMVRQYNIYQIKGNDGEMYHLVSDKDILLVYETNVD